MITRQYSSDLWAGEEWRRTSLIGDGDCSPTMMIISSSSSSFFLSVCLRLSLYRSVYVCSYLCLYRCRCCWRCQLEGIFDQWRRHRLSHSSVTAGDTQTDGPPGSLSACLSVRLSVCLFVSLSVCVSSTTDHHQQATRTNADWLRLLEVTSWLVARRFSSVDGHVGTWTVAWTETLWWSKFISQRLEEMEDCKKTAM